MGKTIVPLNDTKIKNSKPQEKEYSLADGEGLSLLIKPNGSKLWIFRYTSPTTLKRNRASFGKYPAVSLKDARDKRFEYQKLIENNIDPVEHTRAIKEEIKQQESKSNDTFQKILEAYYAYRVRSDGLKEITLLKDKGRVENHFVTILPKKENTSIHDITFNLIVDILKKLEKKNKYSTLTKVKSIIIRVYKYAYSQSIIDSAEIFGKLELYNFIKPPATKNSATLTAKDDIQKLYKDILAYNNSLITKYLLIFTIHTAQRQGSLITARWEDIDFTTKVWTIPKEYMKGTASKSKDHNVALSNIMVRYLKELQDLTGDNEYVFPNSQINKTRNKYPHISNNTVTNALRLMGYSKEQQTAHGFRAMFKTICKENQEEHNLNNEFVERVLAHKVEGAVESAYNRANNVEDMRKVVNWWSNWLEELKI